MGQDLDDGVSDRDLSDDAAASTAGAGEDVLEINSAQDRPGTYHRLNATPTRCGFPYVQEAARKA